ncbi:MAG: FtsQ-type POTRA domain-containing protein [Pseudomonadota bacterium]|nr:FtsQ-type POTRA domain-containing protein [Pseudomonadota bacterium]
MVSLTGILVLALVGIFTAESTRPTADYLRDGFFDATAKAGLHVTDITVEGRRRTQREDLLAVTQIVAGMPILRVDLDAMQTRIEKLPWVYNVTVVRRLPGIIHLHVREREPFALYEEGRKTALIDKSGDVIIRNHLQTFEHLPVLSGSGAPSRAQALMNMLQDYPVVRNRLVAAEWIGGRRWSLTLDHGGAVHLPAKNMQNALNRLMDLERERRILAVENQSIDLRLPDRILLRPMGETSRAAPPRPKREKRS